MTGEYPARSIDGAIAAERAAVDEEPREGTRPFHGPVHVLVVNDAATTFERSDATGVSIALNELLVETAIPLRVGDTIRMSFELEGGDLLALGGQIVRIEDPRLQPAALDGESKYRVAIRFIDHSRIDRERLVQHIFAAERAG